MLSELKRKIDKIIGVDWAQRPKMAVDINQYILEEAANEQTLELYDPPEHLEDTIFESIIIPSPIEYLVLDIPCKVLHLPETLRVLDMTHTEPSPIDIRVAHPLDTIYMRDINICTDNLWSLITPSLRKFSFIDCFYKGIPLSEFIDTTYKSLFNKSTGLTDKSKYDTTYVSLEYKEIISKISKNMAA